MQHNTMMQNTLRFILDIFRKRYLLYQLTKRDFVSRYVDSYLGLTWAILEPLATTIILSVIFVIGFKAGFVQDIPFFLYMFTGIVAYNFFSMATGEGTSVIRGYAFLVKKINFQLSLLPIMKNLSSSLIHFIMLALLVIILFFYGFYPTWYWLQFLYYFLAMNLLVIGISLSTSALIVFVPDIRHLVSIGLQFLFYLSPVFWGIDSIPAKWSFLPKLNPVFYIINGYRDSFIHGIPFWHHPIETIYFWSVTLITLAIGGIVFSRLRPHFADVI